MNFSEVPILMNMHDKLEALAKLHWNALEDDLSLDADLEGVCDETWNKAVSAARRELVAGIEADYRATATKLAALDVLEIPKITDWSKPKTRFRDAGK